MLSLGKEMIKIVLSKNCVKQIDFGLGELALPSEFGALTPLNINLTQELRAGS